MIIFDLDGTLADCEHRRHFVDPNKNNNYKLVSDYEYKYLGHEKESWLPQKWVHKESGKKFKPDWESFYEACDKDKPIKPVIDVLSDMLICDLDMIIFSARCESVREKTENWLDKFLYEHLSDIIPEECRIPIKMRPIGNTEPDEILKERWLDEYLSEGIEIEHVYDDRPKVIRMWRRRGIFVFNCCQHDEEF